MGRPKRFPFGPLTGEPKYKKFLSFDTETRPNEDGKGSHFVLGVVFDGRDYYVFRDRVRMVRHLLSRRYRGYTAWASNLEYDLNALFEEPTWPVFYNYFGGILKGAKALIRARTKVNKAGRTVDCNEWVFFADTLNHWPGGVAEYGRLLGTEKLQMPEVVPTRELETYCCRDAEIVYRMVERCQDIYMDMGCELKSSVASSARDLFRRNYFHEDHAFWPLPRNELDVLRLSYFGARTENFFRGTTNRVWMGDIVSMYPYVMRSIRVPVLTSRLPASTHIKDGLEGIAAVDLEIRKTDYPALPFRYDKLYFPVGKWSGIYTLNELRYAEQHGVKIRKVHFCIQFAKSEYVFREYVDNIFPLKRSATDPLFEANVKLFLNSLYGVFGTGFDSTMIGPSWYDGADLREGQTLGLYHAPKTGHCVIPGEKKYPNYTNFIWPAYITAEARILLHSLLEKYQALYCDTDSVATHRRLRGGKTELGDLDLKYYSKEMEILAPKVYRDDHKTKVKGVPKSAHAVYDMFEEEEIVGFQIGALEQSHRLADRYFYQRASRFRESLRRDLPPNTWHWVEKRLRLIGEKRKFGSDGYSSPLNVRDIEAKPLAKGLRTKVQPSFRIRRLKTRFVA